MSSEFKKIEPLVKPTEVANDGGAGEIPESKPIEELVAPTTRLKSQAELDAEMTLIRLETEKLRLEKEKLELEKLRKDVLDIRRRQEEERVSRETVQESLAFDRENRIQQETFCTHMKGGDSATMMNGGPAQGNDTSNYAMWQHTLTTGVTFRLCSRCGKTWFPKDPDYRWAMTRPTRNSASTGCPSPGLIRNPKKVQLRSELEHRERPKDQYEWDGHEYDDQQ
jgi:hypothetical protein